MTGPTLATLGIVVDNSQVRSAGAELARLGATGDAVGSRLKTAFAGAFAALSAGAVLHKFVEETIAAQNAQAQLAAAVRSTGGAAGFTVSQLQAMASELQRVTTFSDEAVQGAQSLLLTFHSIKGDQFREATAAVIDLATRMGGDLRGAALQVGKALQDPATGLTALRRSGVSFSEGQSAVIKSLQETGRLAEAQALILKELQVEFGGSAAAARDTLGGALAGLKNDFGDMFEATTRETGALVSLINALGGAARAVTEHRQTLIALAEAVAIVGAGVAAFYAALALPALAVWISGMAAATLAVGTLGTAILGGSVLVLGALAPYAALAVAIGAVTAAVKLYREEQRLADEEIAGAARDADVLAFFNLRRATSDAEARTRSPGVFGGPGTAEDLKAEADMIAALRQEADLFGKTAEQARLYKIATSDLTEAEKTLAVAQANRITAAERLAAARADEWDAIDRSVRRLEAEVDARQAALKAVAALAAAIKDARKAAGNETNTALLDQLKAIKEAAESAKNAEKAGDSGVASQQALQDALTNAKALGQEITQAVTGALQLADAFGLVDGSTARLLTTITQIATAANTMAKAIKAGSTGDIISAGLSIVGGLASLFGGGPSPEERERIRVQRENTEAVRLNTAAKELGTALTGNQLGSARSATNALLGLIPGGVGALPGSGTINNRFDQFLTGGGLGTFKDLVDLAKQLGIQLDTSSWQAAVDSLQALDAQLRQNELIRFTETFTGKMQALNAQFVIFGTVDPLTKLTAQLKVAGDLGSITHDAQGRLIRLPGTGSSAINAAGLGLDLATTAGRDQLTANLQALFKQLQAGTLAASALGGLTAQEFLDQLTGLIDLVKQAEDAARARERGLQDLEVRRLRATGQGSAADALAFQLTQQREYQDAVLAGADALTLSTLAEVQRAEALFRSTEAMQEAIDTLQTFGDSLKLDRNLTTLSPVQQLAEARRQYEALLAKAQAGDTAAAQALPDAARAFLEASRAVNASGPAFAADFAKVQADTAALATMFADSIAVEQLIYETNKSMLDELKASNVELQALVAVQAASAAELLAELKATRAENAANAIATKLALEGLSLA